MQSAVGGAALANPLVVKVTDANDNPVQNVSVAWTAIGGGTVSSGGAPAASVTSATNAQGNAQVTRTLGTTLGAYTTTAEVAGLAGSPVTFTSTATVGPASQLVITTQPGGPVANGALLSPQPVVQMRDAGGNNVASPTRTVTAQLLSPPAGAALNGDKTKTTDGGGQAVFDDLNVTGPVGSYTIRFTTPSLTGVNSALVSVTVGPVNAGKSTVDATPNSVAVGVATTITVTARDAGGNAVQGATVQLAATGNNNTFGSASGNTDASGQATASYSSTSPGNHTITATFNGTTTATDNAVVQVATGPPDAGTSIVTASPTAVEAGQISTITVTAKDVGGNPIQGATVVLAADGSGNTLVQPAGTTNSSGVATGTFKSTGLSTHTITAKIDGVDITDNATVDVSAGNPSASQSGLSVSTNSITAGDAGSTVTITVKNASGVPIAGAAVVLSDGDGGNFTAPALTDGSGVTTSTYTNTTAGDHTISATVGSVTISQTQVITVNAAAPASITWTTQPPNPASNGIAFTVDMTVEDTFGNPVSGASVDMTLNAGGSATLNGVTPVTTVNGVATFSLSVSGIFVPCSLTASIGSLTADSNGFTVLP